MSKDEALQIALKALELWINCKFDEDTAWEAHNAIKEALETKEGLLDRKSYLLGLYDQKSRLELETKDEPVAMRYDFDGYGYKYIDNGSGSDWQTRIKDAEPLYTTPQPKQEQVEPVAWSRASFIEDDYGRSIGTDDPELAWGKEPPDEFGWWPLYTTPQRTWIGLTQEEFEKLINDAGFTRSDLLMMGACVEEIVYLVEANLKKKNT